MIKYDILVLCAEKDFNKFTFLHKSIITNIKDYNNIYCVCPVLPEILIENVIYKLDDEVLKIDLPIERSQWVYQQYVKLLQDFTLDNYLVIDADVIINRPIEIISNGLPNFFYNRSYPSPSFTKYIKDVFKMKYNFKYSFVNEIMFFNRQKIQELILETFEDYDEFIAASNKAIKPNCLLSEYQLYGTYIYNNFKDSYNYIKIKKYEGCYKNWSEDQIVEVLTKHTEYDILGLPSM